jgi:hypothetical protein
MFSFFLILLCCCFFFSPIDETDCGINFTSTIKRRNWGFLIPSMKNVLGQDLIPGLKGTTSDRIAILSKHQYFKIADTCDHIPDVWALGVYWNVPSGKKVDLDASVVGVWL